MDFNLIYQFFDDEDFFDILLLQLVDDGNQAKKENFDFSKIDPIESKLLFRFENEDLLRLKAVLNIPDYLTGGTGIKFTGIEGTLRPTCKPGRDQREMFSGHKRTHGQKFQALVISNELIADLYGPMNARRHDSYMLAASGLTGRLEILPAPAYDGVYCIYGDPAYPISAQLIAPFRNANNPNEIEFNGRMSKVRVTVEWEFGWMIRLFAFLDFKKNLKIFLQPVAKLYIVAVILKNCLNCLYGSETGVYFNVQPPTLENYINGFCNGHRTYPRFGRSMRSEFLMDFNSINLNHGGFGGYPREVRQALHDAQDLADSNTSKWYKRELRKHMSKVTQEVARFINANTEDIAIIPNTSSGMNAIFRSLAPYTNLGDRILYFSTVFPGMKGIVDYLQDLSNKTLTSVIFETTYPISDDQLIKNFKAFLVKSHDPQKPIKLALLEHIPIMPGSVIPIEKMIPILKEWNITTVIDGAHTVGQIPLDMKALKPDFYLTNCHKWLYSARAAAVMYMDKKYQNFIHPAIVTQFYSNPAKFQSEFYWQGTVDYSPYLTIPAAIKFREKIGGETAIYKYNHDLAVEGGARMAEIFGTEILQEESQIAMIFDVRLPIKNVKDPMLTHAFFAGVLLRRSRAYCSCYFHGKAWYAHVNTQIYNDLSDFEVLANDFLEICTEINEGRLGNHTIGIFINEVCQ